MPFKRTFKANRSKTIKESNEVSYSSSIVARAGQIMALIIGLGFLVMIASMLVSESLSGDAAQINRAGALRMQALRISRALILNAPSKQVSDIEKVRNLEPTIQANAIRIEIEDFEHRLKHLFEGGMTSNRTDETIEAKYQYLLTQWREIKGLINTSQFDSVDYQVFDSFVEQIDQLVSQLQLASEKKLILLRSVQGISLFSLMLIAFVVLIRLNRTVIAPLKQIVEISEKAGLGDFTQKVEYQSDNELGLLARTINKMSTELALTHQDYEFRVEEKTRALTRTNRSLQVLYKAASNLAAKVSQYNEPSFFKELEQALGEGRVFIKRYDSANSQNETIESESFLADLADLQLISFPIEKNEEKYGLVIWHLAKDFEVKNWQVKMLKAIADMVATTIDLQQKRNTEKRVLIFEERAVIARELHDSLAQSLSYLKVQMSLLTKRMQKEADQKEIDKTINDIKQGLNGAYLHLRELLTTFRLKLDDPSLSNALQGTIVEFSEKCGYQIVLLNSIDENLLTANQEIHILQIIREALSNVHRHARATEAGVELVQEDNSCCVRIWDNGVGADFSEEHPGHFGMSIMEERAKSLGTRIQLGSRKPSGTIVSLQIQTEF
jgi:two-component system, NarL family, nitrate/nitrite sensor histidine kinase NarX